MLLSVEGRGESEPLSESNIGDRCPRVHCLNGVLETGKRASGSVEA